MVMGFSAAMFAGAMAMLAGADTGRMCIVDMGSNTFKLILGEIAGGAYVERQVDRKTMRVGDDMAKTGRISEGKLKDIEGTLSEFRSRCEAKGAVTFGAVATAAFREAENGHSVVDIGARVRIPVEIASEARESALAYLTATDGAGNRAVVDNGSRSIELVSKNQDGTVAWKVVNLGYRAAYDQFFLNAATFAEGYDAMASALARELDDIRFFAGREDFVGIELDEMARFVLNKKNVSGARIKAATLSKQIQQLKRQDAGQFAALKKVDEIDHVLPRLVAVEYLLKKGGYQSVGVVSRELGVGLIIEAGLTR
jgi:exopolyphosphatase / guanosine-5'-triphosphate,3'-diphosphate pyrophosphatase